jgi:hypothetical protein
MQRVMSTRAPITNLRTHEVQNQPSALENYNLFVSDLPLRQALEREGAGWAAAACTTFGEALGSAELIRLVTMPIASCPSCACSIAGVIAWTRSSFTRLTTSVIPVGLMRQALTQALHHA